ncbi:hypothetical protein ACFQZI_16275 [Mucilaginibacter lutimaris]|uniref:DUF998 domain-containing protein n=1 Tax=Mucilaginibacter lutimaris TaxID=931629 RepID=A0ABW2ZJJ0_9SPHI
MFNKPLSTKQITALSFVISLLAIVTSFVNYGESEYIGWPKRLLRPFYFEWPGGENTLLNGTFNIFHFQLFFAALFFIGAMQYATSKQKHSRLLRFGFSLVLLQVR